jgi:EEF1A lysine methyltransferase 4
MSFMTADVRDMRDQFDDHAFDVVLDKGTLDSLLCAEDDTGNAGGMLREVRRVLRPGAHSR